MYGLRKSTISIPFSTIKRKCGNGTPSRTNKFQFHLVRLKDCIISSQVTSFVLFQFHLVRLKVRFLVLSTCCIRLFQFHLVRLKV